jgi:hypothetical protein
MYILKFLFGHSDKYFSTFLYKHFIIFIQVSQNLHLTLRDVEDTASPALFMALHIYTPESSVITEWISKVTNPKSCVT